MSESLDSQEEHHVNEAPIYESVTGDSTHWKNQQNRTRLNFFLQILKSHSQGNDDVENQGVAQLPDQMQC